MRWPKYPGASAEPGRKWVLSADEFPKYTGFPRFHWRTIPTLCRKVFYSTDRSVSEKAIFFLPFAVVPKPSDIHQWHTVRHITPVPVRSFPPSRKTKNPQHPDPSKWKWPRTQSTLPPKQTRGKEAPEPDPLPKAPPSPGHIYRIPPARPAAQNRRSSKTKSHLLLRSADESPGFETGVLGAKDCIRKSLLRPLPSFSLP